MNRIPAEAQMEARRSHSYDESYLQHAPGQQEPQLYSPPQYSQKSTINSYSYGDSPYAFRDDSAVGATTVSPLARLRAAPGPPSPATRHNFHQKATSIPNISPDLDNESVPFDQKQENDRFESSRVHNHFTGSPSSDRSTRPFDEESQAMVLPPGSNSPLVVQSRVHGPHRSFQPAGEPRFRMPPLRMSKPALDAGLDGEEGFEENPDYAHQPPSLMRITHQPDGAKPLPPNSEPAGRFARFRGLGDDSYEEFGEYGSTNTKENTIEEEDSLFDFESRQRQRRHASQPGKESKSRIPLVGEETSEDDDVDGPRRKSAREWKSKTDSHVSFSANNPSVHRYSEYATENSTIAGASLNSEYTKSVESEVEDAIKDIFMIGSGTGNHPGRRKLKHRPDMRRRLREANDLDDETLESEDETPENQVVLEGVPASSKGTEASMERRNRDKSLRDEKKEEETDGFLGAWTMVESGLQAVGAALGIEAQDDEMTFDDSRQEEGRKTTNAQEKALPSRSGRGARQSNGSTERIPANEVRDSSAGHATALATETNMLDYLSGGLLGTPSKTTPDGTSTPIDPDSPKQSPTKLDTRRKTSGDNLAGILKVRSTEEQDDGPPALDKDLRLIELAIQSAESYHKMKGAVYDGSDVDIVTDIKFIVVDLVLPLGLIFQENESGCWVTKVLTEGSAIKKSIQVGDQLAAIDGKSAIRMTVEDIALAIRKKNTNPFELTFLRYVGPLRPAGGGIYQEQGYEVKARLGGADEERKSKLRKQKRRTQEKVDEQKHEALTDPNDTAARDKRRFRLFGRKK